MADAAYLDGLKMLARRDLSEAQVRDRLARRGCDPHAIEAAVTRLKQKHALDDARLAEAISRSAAAANRGRLRARHQMERAGIAEGTAERALAAAFGAFDDALVDAALARRLRGRTAIKDDAEHAQLYRYLIGRGFEADDVERTLARRRHRS